MDEPFHDELTPALADLARAAKDEHEREEQDEQARAFEVIGDHLTAGGFEAGSVTRMSIRVNTRGNGGLRCGMVLMRAPAFQNGY